MAFINRSKSFSMQALLAVATLLLFLAGGAHTASVCRRGSAGIDICRNATYPALCRSGVKGEKEPNAATRTTVKWLMTETKAAMNMAKRVAAKYKGVLSVCLDNYDLALSDLEACLGFLKKHDKFGLQTGLTGATTSYGTCEDAFSESGISSPLAGINQRLDEIVSNAFYLSTLWR